MIKMDKDFKAPVPETEVAIFFGKRTYQVQDRNNPELKHPVYAFTYLDLDTETIRELSIREDNLIERNADKITYGDNWKYEIFRIVREWVKNGNYQNLKLITIEPTGQYMQLTKVERTTI